MAALLRTWIVCAGIVCTGVAAAAPKGNGPAAPKVSAQAQYKAAATQYSNGNYPKALELIEQGLAVAPQDLKLLGLKGSVLLELRDYPGALAAYQAYLKAGPTGANQREAQKIVNNLLAVESTFLDLSLANGPGDVYLDSKTLGVFCRAAPACHQAVLPGEYKVIVERPGFERWTSQVKIEGGNTTKLAVTLVEKPSLLTVRAAPPGARITVDDAAFEAPAKVAAGPHRVVVSLAGHAEERREAVAREGKPIELDIALVPFVPIQVEPAGAELLLGGKPVAIQDGGIPLPPGAHKLVARAPGFQERQIDVPAERGADYKLEVTLERVVVVAPPPPPPPAPSWFTGRRKLALAAGGVGVVAFGAGVVLGLQARRLEDDAYALCPSPSTPCAGAP
ncbi:MAG TPA: PEGA domain-containing protein, partial [Kofleriaceae bacterium]|nr:PEGA domain-containing protein [Kofleriaceae bacterium]